MGELANLPALTAEELDLLGGALWLYLEAMGELDGDQRRMAASLMAAVVEARDSLDRPHPDVDEGGFVDER